MKKLLCIILALVMILMCACNGKTKDPDTGKEKDTEKRKRLPPLPKPKSLRLLRFLRKTDLNLKQKWLLLLRLEAIWDLEIQGLASHLLQLQ